MPHLVFAAFAPPLLVDVFWKSLPVLAIASLASLALRHASAAARHAVWLVTLIGLLFLPIFCAGLPQWSAPFLPAASHSAILPVTPPVIAPTPSDVSAPPMAVPDVSPTPMAVPDVSPTTSPSLVPVTVHDAPPISAYAPPLAPSPTPRTARITLAACVGWIWLAGCLLVLGRVGLGLTVASRLVCRCQLITDGPLCEAAAAARQSLGLSRSLALRIGSVAVPMTCGLRHPVVLLPETAAAWPADRLRAVLLHEAAHVQRVDWATALLAHCVCALYWPHPLVWLAAHRLRAEAETACDDLVLTCGIPAPDYAAHLLDIVQGLSARPALPLGTIAMASRPEVARRLRTILDAHQSRGSVSRRLLFLAGLITLVLIMPLAALRPVGATNRPPLAASKPFIAQGQLLWEQTLPNGFRVTLRHVSEPAAQGDMALTWTPGGTALKSAPPIPPMRSQAGMKLRGFDIDIVSSPNGMTAGATVSWGIVGENSSTTTLQPWQGGSHIPSLEVYATFPVAQTHAALQVSIAAGPKTTLIVAPARSGAIRRLATGETIAISPVKTHVSDDGGGSFLRTNAVSVFLPARLVHNISEFELQPLGANGKPIVTMMNGTNGPLKASHGTDCLWYMYSTPGSNNRVTAFRFTYRPSYTAVFRNVALMPADSGSASTPIVAPTLAAQPDADAQARFLAGLTPVQGPGVIVTLRDSHKTVPYLKNFPAMAPPNLIHDSDINMVINELKAAGAEAIAVNDQRLVATSAIRDAGPTIFINQIPQVPPYLIRAIGDPNTLRTALNLPGGVDYEMRQFDPAMIQIATSPRLTLPAYNGDVPDRYAKPVGAAFTGMPSDPQRVTSVTANVDLTRRPGAMVQGTGGGAKLRFFDSTQTFDFDADTSTLRITSVKANVWRLHDAASNTLILTDNAAHPVIVLNRTPYPLSLSSKAGSPAEPISLPAHALMILNNIGGPLTVSGRSDQGVSYRLSQPKTSLPVTIIRSVPSEQSMTSFGNETTNTDFDL